jgi:CRISPR-associated protein Cas4
MTAYDEDELLPISALPQLVYCERRCALMHIEGLWDENRFTVLGEQMHRRVHEGHDERRPGVRICRGVPLRSLELGLVGVADVVEFPVTDEPLPQGLAWLEDELPPDTSGTHDDPPPSAPFPVEYKRGQPKSDRSDEVQLCAQALCLEEMLGVEVPEGALYYGRSRRRTRVTFDAELRRETRRLAARLHQLVSGGRTPPAVYEPAKCRACSLVHLCLPEVTSGDRSAGAFLRRMLRAAADL